MLQWQKSTSCTMRLVGVATSPKVRDYATAWVKVGWPRGLPSNPPARCQPTQPTLPVSKTWSRASERHRLLHHTVCSIHSQAKAPLIRHMPHREIGALRIVRASKSFPSGWFGWWTRCLISPTRHFLSRTLAMSTDCTPSPPPSSPPR